MKNQESVNDNIKNLSRLTRNLTKVLLNSFELARRKGAKEISATEIFTSILSNTNCIASRLLIRLGMDIDATKASLEENYTSNEIINFAPELGENARHLLTRSFLIASELGHVYVGTEHMLLAILQEEDLEFVKELSANGLTYEFVKGAMLNFGVYQPGVFADSDEKLEDEEKQENIYFFARDMNKLAQEGRYLKVWGRDEEIERMIHILSRKTKNNPIIVGEAGVGKTAIVEGLVQRILEGKVPSSFRNKTIIQLDLSAILAGSKIRGDVEERLLSIIDDLAQHPDWIVFIDEIHMIVGAGAAGSGGSMDIANMLKPHLTSGDIRVIGATTYDEFQKHIEDDPALERRFQPVMVDELSAEDSKKVLKLLRPAFEKFHGVKITDEALEEAVELSSRYITNKYLPDKAIDVLDEATAGKRISAEKTGTNILDIKKELNSVKSLKDKALDKGDIGSAVKQRQDEVALEKKMSQVNKTSKKKVNNKLKIEVEDIRKVISRWSKIPVVTMKSDDYKKLVELEKNLEKRIVGQNEGINKISSVLKRARLGLSYEKRPMASFLFLGPTGVGKTETAKEIARTYFGDEKALIQVDMSEYMEQHSVSKLIGSPPGYVGFQEGGQLTEKIRRRPYSVVLFDEIEKAHPDLLNIMLQILDEGSLQDAKGRKINFKNTIIIMTSNIGASEIGKDDVLGFGVDDSGQTDEKVDKAFEQMRETLMRELKDELPPEFLNRIDDIIIFRGLDLGDVRKITKILVDELNQRLKEKGIQVAVTQSAVKHIAEAGYDSEYGARNVRRKIQELVENPLADYILENSIKPDGSRQIIVKLEKGKSGLVLK
ncbi:MAG TPA: ATP-dependent Clp protease ATP-binding subunit [Candidatus Dojkabacteria bacterium]|nr:ATP-dependent Clp protease ATP-binding subunit [Candidatus Dojkabacteria bacterium]